MLQRDVIEPSSSPWASPVVFIKKKNGSSQVCVDYHELNNVMVKDSYPLPRIDNTLDSLAGARCFSTLDLVTGHWQVGLSDSKGENSINNIARAVCFPLTYVTLPRCLKINGRSSSRITVADVVSVSG